MRFLLSIALLLSICVPWSVVRAQGGGKSNLTQKNYRWYVNTDNQTEKDPWPSGANDLAENTPITKDDAPPYTGDILRLRINLESSSLTESGVSYKLQYTAANNCSNVKNTWTDVGGLKGTEAWIGYDNSSVTHNDQLASLLLSSSNVNQSYAEENPAQDYKDILNGQQAEWDWVIKNNDATPGAKYCFRMVTTDGELYAYDDYPQLRTGRMVAETQNWRWYGDENSETPIVALAAENTELKGAVLYDTMKLRVTAKNTKSIASENNQVYELQYATNTAFTNAQFVETYISDCADGPAWCLANGGDDTFDPLSTLLLTDSDTLGFHLEALSGPTDSNFIHGADDAVELEFTLKAVNTEPGMQYYFRLFDVNAQEPVLVADGETPPTLIMREPRLVFAMQGVDANSVIDSYTTNVASTADQLNFGVIAPGEDYIAAHRLYVSEDLYGYQIYLFAVNPLQNAEGYTIQGVSGTNELPTPWSFTQSPTLSGVFGYHTTDELLSNGSTRFASQDTWAAITDEPAEVVHTDGVVENDYHDILYRINIGTTQPQSTYQTEIMYVVIGLF